MADAATDHGAVVNVVKLYDRENDPPDVTLADLLALIEKANAAAQESLAILRSLAKEQL